MLVSTQSSAFVDSFEPDDIVVVQRNQEATEFKRPQAEELDSWVEDYASGKYGKRRVPAKSCIDRPFAIGIHLHFMNLPGK